MNLSTFLSISGRIGPRAFAIGAVAVYIAGVLSQILLLSGPVIRQLNVIPNVAAQLLLLWIWIVLHVKRLRDAERAIWPAMVVAGLYALSVALLMGASAAVLTIGDVKDNVDGMPGVSALGFFVVLYALAALFGAAPLWTIVLLGVILLILAYVPSLIAIGFSIWTGTRDAAAPPSHATVRSPLT